MRNYRALITLSIVVALLGRLEPAGRAQLPPSGGVLILGESGSRVLLDGQVMGQLPLSAPLLVAAGTHRLALEGGGRVLEASVEVRAGHRLDVRFDNESGAALVSQPPAAIVLPRYQGVSFAARLPLERAIADALEEAALLPFDHTAALGTRPDAAACLKQPQCLLELATKNEVPYILAFAAETSGNIVADWHFSADLTDTAVAEVAAETDKRCERCTIELATEQLGQLVRSLLSTGMNRPHGKLEVRSEPAGAAVTLNGKALGETPLQKTLFTGGGDLTVEHAGYLPEHRHVVIKPGQTTQIELPLTIPPPSAAALAAEQVLFLKAGLRIMPMREPRPRWRLIAGGSSLGLGALFLGFGIGALSVNGQCIDQVMAPAARCDMLYATQSLGTGLSIVGATLSLGGAILLVVPGRRKGAGAYATSDHGALAGSGRL